MERVWSPLPDAGHGWANRRRFGERDRVRGHWQPAADNRQPTTDNRLLTTAMRFMKRLLVILACSTASVAAASAAEIRLKPQARTSASVVTLGDVADVFTADAFQGEQLRGIELGPAPAPGRRRYVRVR